MSFPRYPAYKDSGVEWLGQIPKTWESIRLKHLFSLEKRPVRDEDQIVTCFRDGVVTLRNNRRTEGFTTALQEIGYQGIRRDDLVIHAMDAFAGAIGVSDSDGKATPVYSVCSSKGGADPKYYGYLLRNMALTGFVESLAKGIRERSTDFRWSEASVIELPAPTLDEQVVIARFLDHETAKIDSLIQEQQCLIELLKEKRQAVISHAVTKGLDPSVPMKDSGVEWLGEVPAHWEIRKVSFDFTARKGPRGALLTKEYCSLNPGPYPVYSGQTEYQGVLGTIDDFDFSLGQAGAILTTTVGAKAMSVSFIQGHVSLSQNCMLIAPLSPSILTEFFYYHFQPLFQYERRLIPDHMQPSFRMEDLYSFQVAHPPMQEQDRIARHLDAAVNETYGLITKCSEMIQLLQERRSALISAAVTGKIDVRNWKPPVDESAFDEEVRHAGLEAVL